MSAKNNVHKGFSSRAGTKILVLCASAVVVSQPAATAEQDEWSRIEQEMALEQQALDVNEGELQLLDQPPVAASHFHHTRLMITAQSVRDGWVTMYQCHSDLDRVASSQIVYQQNSIRNLRVVSSQNIGSARVEGHTVQMQAIAADSRICISADRRALSFENGRYYLRLGPFVRRFLDGYYPMRVRVEVCYPGFLQLVGTSPVKALLHETNENLTADIDLWVVGELNIEFVFVDRLRDQ